MARTYVTGDVEIEAQLDRLAHRDANSIARSALGYGLSQIRKSIKRQSPVLTGRTKKTIGRRLDKTKRGLVRAKTGIEVGKGVETNEYSHIVGLQTHFVRNATISAMSAASAAMKARAEKRLQKLAEKKKG